MPKAPRSSQNKGCETKTRELESDSRTRTPSQLQGLTRREIDEGSRESKGPEQSYKALDVSHCTDKAEIELGRFANEARLWVLGIRH